jgi:peptidoglycan/xylan/chitin deacetylase (PgdA/CDA1 family)
MTANQIKDLSGSFEIGGHTLSHQILTDIPDTKAGEEINNCKKWLEDITAKEIQSFCPPTGKFNKEHVLFQRKAGFRLLRTVEMLAISLQAIRQTNGIVILPTTTQVYDHSRISYLKNLTKRLNFDRIPTLIRMFDRRWQTMSRNYLTVLHEAAGASDKDYYFHLWGHSWEIEKHSLWNSAEQFFKGAAELDGVKFCTNSELGEIVRNNGKRES